MSSSLSNSTLLATVVFLTDNTVCSFTPATLLMTFPPLFNGNTKHLAGSSTSSFKLLTSQIS